MTCSILFIYRVVSILSSNLKFLIPQIRNILHTLICGLRILELQELGYIYFIVVVVVGSTSLTLGLGRGFLKMRMRS